MVWIFENIKYLKSPLYLLRRIRSPILSAFPSLLHFAGAYAKITQHPKESSLVRGSRT